jgi:hypothetical protein
MHADEYHVSYPRPLQPTLNNWRYYHLAVVECWFQRSLFVRNATRVSKMAASYMAYTCTICMHCTHTCFWINICVNSYSHVIYSCKKQTHMHLHNFSGTPTPFVQREKKSNKERCTLQWRLRLRLRLRLNLLFGAQRQESWTRGWTDCVLFIWCVHEQIMENIACE